MELHRAVDDKREKLSGILGLWNAHFGQQVPLFTCFAANMVVFFFSSRVMMHD
jgi:hypothetical protein